MGVSYVRDIYTGLEQEGREKGDVRLEIREGVVRI